MSSRRSTEARPDLPRDRDGSLKTIGYPAMFICIDCALVYLLLGTP